MTATARLTQLIVAASGALYALTAIALIFAPRWFFANVGDFPPFNRHYAGDAGTFLLPLGVALVLAARRPWAHTWVVGIGVAVSVLHAANHGYDAARGDESTGAVLALAGFAVLLAVAFVAAVAKAER